MLTGRKTYLAAVAIAAIQFAQVMGWLTTEETQTATNLLLGGGLAALRMGVANK